MELSEWQALLAGHFRGVRKIRPQERPIFALEHGLSETQLAELTAKIRAEVASGFRNKKFYLPWVVYSSEIGYGYTGEEYWQTFENETPQWMQFGDRYWIRSAFEQFETEFQAAKPTGPWARHFSIICWPITHAILPTDLQRHLARLLYNLRYYFESHHLQSPESMGKLLAAHSWDLSKRFQFLAQTPLLLGQIASALLLQESDSEVPLIHQSTLDRISLDLEKIRGARDWLAGAQNTAQKLQLKGLRHESWISRDKGSAVDRSRHEVISLGLEPRLLLRPTEDGEWKVYLEIQSLLNLIGRFPNFREVLFKSRCAVAGASGAPLARGMLLYGSQKVELSDWPELNETLLKFEEAPEELNFLLRTECLLRPGPVWLFKLQSDGWAHEVRGGNVRPGETYFLLNIKEELDFGNFGSSVEMGTFGVFASKIEVPPVISEELSQILKTLNLHQNRSFEVWPSGICPAKWDDEGRAEWTYPDQPKIGLLLDHDASSVRVELQGALSKSLTLANVPSGSPAFLCLGDIPPGFYELRIKINYTEGGGSSETGTIEVAIRAPQATIGALPNSPLLLIPSPIQPTLEELWRGECSMEIIGPRGHVISCIAELRNQEGKIIDTISAPNIELPVGSSWFTDFFRDSVRRNQQIQDRFDTAHSLRWTCNGGEVGVRVVEFEREFTPLRWVAQKNDKGEFSLKLLNDTGAQERVRVSHYDFTSPDTPKPLDAHAVETQFVGAEEGGLYVASIANEDRSIIAPPAKKKFDWSALKLKTTFQHVDRRPFPITEFIEKISFWEDARLPGNFFATVWRNAVLTSSGTWLFYIVGGKNWSRGERAVHTAGMARDELLVQSLRFKKSEQAFAAKIIEGRGEWLELPLEERRAKFSTLLLRYGLLEDPRGSGSGGRAPLMTKKERAWFSELSLRLASAPGTLIQWCGKKKLEEGLLKLLDSRVVPCAARYVVLSCQPNGGGRTDAGEIRRLWDWR